MAKPIYVTENDINDIYEEIRETLAGLKCYGKVEIKRSLKSDDRTAMLYFTPKAWIKMTALVSRFKTEVQWHGLVQRISEDEFEVYDILVPPHEVSGATVTSAYEPYIKWRDELDDDTFNAERFHGHSHVDMGVSPSTTDEKYRYDLVTQFQNPIEGEDLFYIFLIINKKHEWSAQIYDFTNNALYDTGDIEMECYFEGESVDEFITEAKKVAVEKTYNTVYSQQSRLLASQYPAGYSFSNSNLAAYNYQANNKSKEKSKKKEKNEFLTYRDAVEMCEESERYGYEFD